MHNSQGTRHKWARDARKEERKKKKEEWWAGPPVSPFCTPKQKHSVGSAFVLARCVVETNSALAAIARDCFKMLHLFLLSPKSLLRNSFRGPPISPFCTPKQKHPHWSAFVLARCKGLEPLTYWFVEWLGSLNVARSCKFGAIVQTFWRAFYIWRSSALLSRFPLWSKLWSKHR